MCIRYTPIDKKRSFLTLENFRTTGLGRSITRCLVRPPRLPLGSGGGSSARGLRAGCAALHARLRCCATGVCVGDAAPRACRLGLRLALPGARRRRASRGTRPQEAGRPWKRSHGPLTPSAAGAGREGGDFHAYVLHFGPPPTLSVGWYRHSAAAGGGGGRGVVMRVKTAGRRLRTQTTRCELTSKRSCVA